MLRCSTLTLFGWVFWLYEIMLMFVVILISSDTILDVILSRFVISLTANSGIRNLLWFVGKCDLSWGYMLCDDILSFLVICNYMKWCVLTLNYWCHCISYTIASVSKSVSFSHSSSSSGTFVSLHGTYTVCIISIGVVNDIIVWVLFKNIFMFDWI